ncbi:PQQ-binding-like beta-propeller repeat protein [Daejeonella sp.]|uniref:outer membrane protein assembly factor BamB family protein n=1 Tax=Daejeonella sp. TaxID=2805397 RepID=UPI0039839054
MNRKKLLLLAVFYVLLVFAFTGSNLILKTGKDWPVYGGNKAGNRYSPLDQINTGNVTKLKVAWMYNAAEKPDLSNPTQSVKAIQCQPIVVNGVLYGTTPELKLFALDAATGREIWLFKPVRGEERFNSSRGVMYWERGSDKRILYTVGSSLYAVNIQTGKVVTSFGNNGLVDLHEGLSDGLDTDVSSLSVSATSPGVIHKNTLVIGSSVSEAGDAAPGYIRAFDVISGKLKWVFHTIPHPGEFGYDSWPKDAYKKIGGANSWSGIVLDEKRGVVYFGTGSPSSDFYGGDRKGRNLFANSIMALDAESGKMKWYYQTIAHDLWDRDHPTPPNLTTIKHNGKMRDVVVQATKDGQVYVLDRDKGISIFPVEERAVPVDGLPGEFPWPLQKFPLKPASFSHQTLTENDLTDISPESNAFVKDLFKKYRTDNKFAPPSVQGTLLFGYSGGAEWGGNAIDPEDILYQNSNDEPWILEMLDTLSRNKLIASASYGNALYLTNCASCHGQDRKGNGTQFPDLERIEQKLSISQISNTIKSGVGRMPSFQQLSESDRVAIADYLHNPRSARPTQQESEHAENLTKKSKPKQFGFQPAYIPKVWKKLVDQNGYPGTKPPWGTLNAINLGTGEYLWRVPLGEYPELTKKGIPITGTESYGGPIATAGGLVFIAGTKDERIRAFDKKTGKVLWEYQLPAGGFATPITYSIDGKQYVVIAAGGARGQKPGGNYIAFSL